MIVLGIYGSPREGGNSDILLDRALEGASQEGATIKKVYAREIDAPGCKECGGCDSSGVCVQEDSMQKVYPMLQEADAIIISTPIFFYAMPAQLKAIIDRAQAPWNKKMMEKTPEQRKGCQAGKGYLIAVGATKGSNLFEGVELTARYFFDALDMSYQGGIFFRQVEDKAEIRKRPKALDRARRLGKRAASG